MHPKLRRVLKEIVTEEVEISDAIEGDEDENFGHDNKIEIECSEFAAKQIYPLLKELKYMGDAGASRQVKIDNYDGEDKFGFDGDGSSKIGRIRVNGEEIE